ncbi:ribonuclease P protein component [Nautilia sp.]
MLVYYLPLNGLKVSPVVSKRISKKAVVRNKIKRRIRHIAYGVFKRGGFAVVVKKNISESDFDKLKKEFEKINNKID